jgi:hypothetical protein
MRYVGSLVRIALTVAVINAVARVGFAYWAFYQFRDKAEQTAIFGAQEPTWALHAAVMSKADELFLPVEDDQVTVERDGFRTIIEADYTQPIELFPNQTYPMKFSFSVEGFRVNDGRLQLNGSR